MTETNITPLRPKAKDPTGAQRQKRFRSKKKPVVTVPADRFDNLGNSEVERPSALPAVAHPTPQKGKDIPTVTAPRNGTGIAVATMVAALSLATVSAGFSITGMTAIFVGALYPVVGMGVALELGKLSAVAWLGHRDGSASWALKMALTLLAAILMALNAVGCFGYLSRAHIASALAGDLAVAGRRADIEARLAMQASAVADLDRRIAKVDLAIEKATENGRTAAAMKLAEEQRRTRSELASQRVREGKVLLELQVEKVAVDGERKKAEADLGPVRYLATLLGAGDQDVLRWFILVVASLLDPAAVLLLFAATRR